MADGRLDLLKSLSEQLEVCQKSLSEYLDTKRCAFPRFYFISDDELLSILGTSDPTSVQEHMLKLFDNCAALVFGRGNKTITGMVSSEKEGFEFRNVVPIEGAVELWMTNVEAEMRKTLYQVRRMDGACRCCGSLCGKPQCLLEEAPCSKTVTATAL